MRQPRDLRGRLPLIGSLTRGQRSGYAIRSFVGQMAFAVVAFLSAVLAARILGPAGKGTLTGWTYVGTMLPLLLAASVPLGLARLRMKRDDAPVLTTAVAHGAIALAVCLALATIAVAAGADSVAVLCFLVVAAPVAVVSQDLYFVIQAIKTPWRYQLSRLAGVAVYAGGLLVLFMAAVFDERWVWALFAAGSVVTTSVSLATLKPVLGWRGRPQLIAASREGRGLFITAVLDLLFVRMDQFIVLAVVGPAGLGVYSVAVNWSEITRYAAEAVGQATFEDERTLHSSETGRLFRRIVIYLMPASVAVAASGFLLIPPIFGGQFAEARWVLLLLFPGLVCRALFQAGSSVMMARGRAPELPRLLVTVLAVITPAAILAVSALGIYGAAAVSTLAYLAQMLVILSRLRGSPHPASS